MLPAAKVAVTRRGVTLLFPAGFFARWLMPCESCKKHGCSEMGEFCHRWLIGRYVYGTEEECLDYTPRWCRGLEGVAA